MPRFSILMPVSRTEFFVEAVNSVLTQTFTDWELIVRSSSGGPYFSGLLPEDVRIDYRRIAADRAEKWNSCIADARGDILHFLADDDKLHPMALEYVDAAFAGWPMWAYGNMETFSANTDGHGWLDGPEVYDFESEKTANSIPGGAVFFRREVAEQIGGMDETLNYCGDWDFWLRMGARWKPACIPHVLSFYRRHAQQDSNVHAPEVHRDVLEVMRRAKEGYYDRN